MYAIQTMLMRKDAEMRVWYESGDESPFPCVCLSVLVISPLCVTLRYGNLAMSLDHALGEIEI